MAMRNNEFDNIYVPFTIFTENEEGKIEIKDQTSLQMSKVKTEFGHDFKSVKDISLNLKVNAMTPVRLYEYEEDYGYYRLLYMTFRDKDKHTKDNLIVEDTTKIDIICLDTGTDKLYHADPTIFLISDVVSLDQEYEHYVGFTENIFEDTTEFTENGIINLEKLLTGGLSEFELLYMDKAHEIHNINNVAFADYYSFKKLNEKLEVIFRQLDYATPKVLKAASFSWHNLYMKYIQSETKELYPF